MLNDNLLELIENTSEILNLEDAVVEKDYYVTQIIHTLSNIENEYFRLIFAGGTCLAKAHKVVMRMSEDVDFKIQIKKGDINFSRSKLIKELKEFRTVIKNKLTQLDLHIGEPIVRNEGKYSRIEIKYPSAFPINTNLRPHILLEFTLSEIFLATEALSIKTLIENTLKNTVISSSPVTPCISINETAIEKWVGLTRRVIAIERTYHPDDATLIRHVYDLNAISKTNKVNDNFFTLTKTIINNDAKQVKNQHPEYSANPRQEIRYSLKLLRSNPIWQERYHNFIATMVYGDTVESEYNSALLTLEQFSEKVINYIFQ